MVCRIFKKKHLHKTLDSPILGVTTSSITTDITRSTDQHFDNSCDNNDEGALEHVLEFMGSRTCKEGINEANNSLIMNHINGFHDDDSFLKLPSLESPKSSAELFMENDDQVGYQYVDSIGLMNWAALDSLVASQLNGHETMTYTQLGNCFSTNHHDYHDHELQLPSTLRSSISSNLSSKSHHATSEIELWGTFSPQYSSSLSSSDALCHISNSL